MQVAEVEGFRLSPIQQRLWKLQQSDQVFRAQCALSLSGPLDWQGLCSALEKVVRRHEILRATFPRLSGMNLPLQSFGDSAQPAWQFQECETPTCMPVFELVEQLFQHDERISPNWQQGPLTRFELCRLQPDEHLLFVSIPSLCADLLSLKNLALEIRRAYAAGTEGTEEEPLPLQYLQFSEWYHELLESGGGDED